MADDRESFVKVAPHFQAIQLNCVRGQKTLSRDINFSLHAGEFLFIEGANGSGKTSLLRHLAALSSSTEGQLFWRGTAIANAYPEYWQDLHYVGHTNGIKLGLTAIENLQLMLRLTNAGESIIYSLEQALSILQLEKHKNILASDLSAGQKRRLALARLWLIQKPLWILDEPLTALDKDSQTIFMQHFDQHLTRGGIAILSSHQPLPGIENDKRIHHLRLMPC